MKNPPFVDFQLPSLPEAANQRNICEPKTHVLRLPSCTWRNPALDPSTPGLIGVSVDDTLAKLSALADAAEPVAYPEEFNIDTDESSESEEVETVETLASADGTGDGDAGDAGDGDGDDPDDPETEVKPEAKVAGPAARLQIGESNYFGSLESIQKCAIYSLPGLPSSIIIHFLYRNSADESPRMVMPVIPLPHWARCGCDWKPCCWMPKSPAMPGPCWPVRVSGCRRGTETIAAIAVPRQNMLRSFKPWGNHWTYLNTFEHIWTHLNTFEHYFRFISISILIMCISISMHLGSMIGPCLDPTRHGHILVAAGLGAGGLFSNDPPGHEAFGNQHRAPGCPEKPWTLRMTVDLFPGFEVLDSLDGFWWSFVWF